jgi:putative RNase toxin 11 of polymorphic toxin system
MAASQLYQLFIENPTKNIARRRSPIMKLTGYLPEQKLQNSEIRLLGTQQFELDAAMWYGAIRTGPYKWLLTKLFHIFYHAGVMYNRNDQGWKDWSTDSSGNVASLLSHGQRVLVQIPTRQKGGEELWAWLNQPNQIPSRPYATHGQSCLSKPVNLIKGHRQYVVEKGGGVTGWGQSVSGRLLGRHFAFNVALGGNGNRNPFSPTNDDEALTYKPIKADGLNGHVYINYMPPENNSVGGMLVGCENAQHGKGSNPHTGAGHGLGGSQKVSACGGLKWSTMKSGPLKEYNGFICDLTDRRTDLKWLIDAELFDPDLLDGPTRPVVPVNTRVPILPSIRPQHGQPQAWET